MTKWKQAVAVTLASLAIASCSSTNEAFTTVALRDVDGGERTLSDVANEVVVVNFWASYCKPCIREMPALQSVADSNPDVAFIGVNALDERDKALEMVDATGVLYDIWLDERGDVMAAAGIRSLPGTLVLRENEVVWRVLGEVTAAELQEAIDGAVG